VVGLTLALLRAHRGQALTVFLLAMLAVAGAVAAPVYTDLAGRAIAAADIAAAPSNQRTITALDGIQVKGDPGTIEGGMVEDAKRRDFEHVAPPVLATPGFGTAFAVAIPAFVQTAPDASADGRPASSRGVGDKNGDLEFRDGFCERIFMLSGRCVAAPGEVVVTAGRPLALNATAFVVAAKFVGGGPGLPGAWATAGDPCPLAVVGVYRPRDPADPYWGRSSADMAHSGAEPVLADRQTIATCDHEQETQEVVTYAEPGTFALDRLDEVRAAVVATKERARGRVTATSDIETLLGRIDRDRRTVALIPRTAAVPLLALCWFVLFLAIANTTQARRTELGMIKLRGVSRADQWYITAAQSLIPVLAGGIAGYLVGHLASWVYGRMAFGPGVTAPLTPRPWAYAAVALGGAVVAAAIPARRDLSASATDLLRQVPSRAAAWGGLALAGLLAVGAAAAVVQLRDEDPTAGAASGVALLAPALALVALGLAFGALLDPVAAWIGARTIHSGRIGLAMAALHLGRRHAGARLVAVLVVAIGLLTFGAAAAEAAQDARADQLGADIGASQVLTVAEVRPAQLLRTVRSIDPGGSFAMAVVRVDPAPTGRELLAVDSTRLARVALWPRGNGDLTAAAAQAALRPATPATFLVRGVVAVTATIDELVIRTPGTSLNLWATVTPTDGSPSLTQDLGPLRTGRQTYQADFGCAGGCRLSTLAVAPSGPVDGSFRLVLNGINADGDAVIGPAELANWRVRNPGVLQTRPGADGLELSAVSSLFQLDKLRLLAPDAPVPLPVLDAAPTIAPVLDLANGDHLLETRAGQPHALPRIGGNGALADLEYVTRLGDLAVPSRSGEIWLGPDAPADAVDRFRAAGLTVASVRRLADELAVAARGPGAAGVRFLFVVAMLGVVLGAAGLVLVATVERPNRSDELRWLRQQGLSRRRARQAAVLGYAVVVGVSAVLGFVCAGVVWALTADHLPLLDTSDPDAAIPALPGAGAIAVGAAGAAAMLVLALILSAMLSRAVERPPRVERSAS